MKSQRVYIGLGGNLGDARATLGAALDALRVAAVDGLVQCSRWYRSAPLDASGPDFLNAVACFETRCSPEALLQELHRIEDTHGRNRPYRNAPRTLDLDLLLYGEAVMATETLVVPHPRMRQRAFVLMPLADLDPALVIPGQGALRELVAAVADQAIELAEPPPATFIRPFTG